MPPVRTFFYSSVLTRSGRFPRIAATRRRLRSCRGVGMVEFALISPLVFLVLLGLVVVGIAVTNYVQLSNAARDGARAAGICGGSGRDSTTTLPNGQPCSTANLTAYIQSRLQAVPAPVSFTVNVVIDNAVTSNDLDDCQNGASIEIVASFAQPLYMPLIGQFLGDGGGGTRTITAKAEATCEQ
jgi:Flp pilus assembly protein TadG